MEDVCTVTFYEGKAISVELPITIVREVEYTEPSVRGDTSGKVTKPATLKGTKFTISVADFVKTWRQDRNRYPYQRIQKARLISHFLTFFNSRTIKSSGFTPRGFFLHFFWRLLHAYPPFHAII